MEIAVVVGIVLVVVVIFSFKYKPSKEDEERFAEARKKVEYIQSLPLDQRKEATNKLLNEAKKTRKERELLGKGSEISKLILSSVIDGDMLDSIYKNVEIESNRLRLSDEQIKLAIFDAIANIINKETEENIFTKEKEDIISSLIDHYNICINDLPQQTLIALVKGRLLRNLLDGNIAPCVNDSERNLPFKFVQSEIIIYGWGNMRLSTIKTTSRFVGRSQGFSVKIAKGVYYRAGAFNGERISNQELISLGSGPVAITSQHLYYALSDGSKRIKHDKIISITPYADGVLVSAEGASSKAILFQADDPGFFANALQNASNWA